MEIIRDYQELLDLAVSTTVHPIDQVVGRLVLKGVIRPEVARVFLAEIR